MANKIPKLVTVHRKDGSTFQRTQMVNADEVTGDKDKSLSAPQPTSSVANKQKVNLDSSVEPEKSVTAGSIAEDLYSAITEASTKQDKVHSKLPRGTKIGEGVNRVNIYADTAKDSYSAYVTTEGELVEKMNGKEYSPDENPDQAKSRKIRGVSKAVRKASGQLKELALLTQEVDRKKRAVDEAILYRVVGKSGEILELHYSERGAEIAKKSRHPEATVEEPKVSRVRYEEALNRRFQNAMNE